MKKSKKKEFIPSECENMSKEFIHEHVGDFVGLFETLRGSHLRLVMEHGEEGAEELLRKILSFEIIKANHHPYS